MNLNLLYENLLFFAIATAFFLLVGRAWKDTKLYNLPQPLPAWFTVWFLTVQIGGGLVPVIALFWSIWQRYSSATEVLVYYFLMLGLQILSESVSLRRFHSTAFVMVPYLYLPYRIWQLYEGTILLGSDRQIIWFQYLLIFEIVLWTLNYALDLSQLPRLFHWPEKEKSNPIEKSKNLI